MKKYLAITLSATLLLSGCGSSNSNTAAGGFMGAQLGSILGSAIGGISGGPRGSDIGTIVGMAGGAVVGAVAGNAADKANRQSDYTPRQTNSYDFGIGESQPQEYNDSGFDPDNGGDDVIDFGTPILQNTGGNDIHIRKASGINIPTSGDMKALEVRSVKFDNHGQGTTLSRGDLAQIVVEVFNNSNDYIYNVEPVVTETTGNKHIYVSSPVRVEQIAPGRGIKYTAMVKADNKLKEGNAHFVIAVNEGNTQIKETREININTSK